MKRILLLAIVALYFFNAQAQEGRQHKGFFLSMGLGPVFGPIHMNSTDEGEYDMTGTGVSFDFKIGGAVTENVILHATLLSSSLNGPKVKNTSGQFAKTSNNLMMGESLLGGGLTYYFMPLNAFVSGSAGVAYFNIDNQDINYKASTDPGFGFQLKAGKEWWVSKRWGLGVAAFYGHSSVDNQPSNTLREKLTSNRFGILFSATLD